jgi:alpha-beta hydrolase superfamily lysophospholipase
MNKVISADGTPIAFERLGAGQPVIVVVGATCDRRVARPLAERLAQDFTVFNYDRRGRGDSGDTAPYAVEREIEDLGALIAEAGGEAAAYGHSSGAALVLRAAAAGLPISRCVLHEPPFSLDDDPVRHEYGAELRAILADGRRGDALALFMMTTGMPAEAVRRMRDEPWWKALEVNAPSLAYDSEVMGDLARGAELPLELAANVTMPTLALEGGAGQAWMIEVGSRLAQALPNGRLSILPDQEHVVPPEILVPELIRFFTGSQLS